MSWTDEIEDGSIEFQEPSDEAINNAIQEVLAPNRAAQEIENIVERRNALLSEAMVRMEQANLYKTILDNNIFSEGSARPEILEMVEQEFKTFAEEKLSVFLGMKQPKKEVESVFSEDEISILKTLVGKVRKTITPQSESVKLAPPKPSLNTISTKPAQKPSMASASQPKAIQPQSKTVKSAPAPKVAAPEPAPQQRHKRPRSPHQKPVPSLAEQMAMYAQQTSQLGSGADSITNAIISNLKGE